MSADLKELSDNDISRIAKAVKGHTQSTGEKMSDNAMKVLVALCTVGIVWIASSISDMKTEQVRIDEWRIMSMRQMDKMEQFMEAPRFDSSSFAEAIYPYAMDIRDNKSTLDRRSSTVEQVKLNTKDIVLIKNKLDIEE